VFENRVLGRIFGPKRDEVTGGWRKLHNEELHNLYMGMAYRSNGQKRKVYRLLVRKSEENAPLGRPRSRCVNNIKMVVKEIGWGVWSGLIWLSIGTSEMLLSTR
jgi:hypothetical protein